MASDTERLRSALTDLREVAGTVACEYSYDRRALDLAMGRADAALAAPLQGEPADRSARAGHALYLRYLAGMEAAGYGYDDLWEHMLDDERAIWDSLAEPSLNETPTKGRL